MRDYKTLKLKHSDCGNHFVNWNNKVDLNIPSETSCAITGDCIFYQKDKYNKDDIVDVLLSYSLSETGEKEGCAIVAFVHKDGTKFISECTYERENCISVNEMINKYYI